MGVTVKIKKLSKDAKLPNYAHPGDAGMDFYSSENVCIKSNETKTVSTGISMAIPDGYVGLIWDKSGIASKNSVHTMAGVVDCGYRGEIKIVVRNFGHSDFVIEKGMKFAQMLIQPVIPAELVETDTLDTTSRNDGGFGSTGK